MEFQCIFWKLWPRAFQLTNTHSTRPQPIELVPILPILLKCPLEFIRTWFFSHCIIDKAMGHSVIDNTKILSEFIYLEMRRFNDGRCRGLCWFSWHLCIKAVFHFLQGPNHLTSIRLQKISSPKNAGLKEIIILARCSSALRIVGKYLCVLVQVERRIWQFA